MAATSDDVATPGAAEFRDRVRVWVAAEAERFRPPGVEDEAAVVARQRARQRSLYEHRLAGITVPVELGGLGLSVIEQIAFNDEVPAHVLDAGHLMIGLGMVVPTLVAHGTPEQQAHVPRLLSAEQKWCQLFSEPGAGSDLAALATRAVADGDEWVVDGQKVWTSGARYAEHGILLARTDASVPKHRGLTMFALDMTTPGITIRPLRQMTGRSGFNEVFLDGVRVPDRCRIGGAGQGWTVAITTLMNERVTIGSRGSNLADALIATARGAGLAGDPVVRDALAEVWIRETILGYLGQRIRAAVLAGRQPGPEGSIAKLGNGALAWQAGSLGVRLAGMGALARRSDDDDARSPGEPAAGWADVLCGAPGLTIAGGTTEVQKNIIGERVLGLPREPKTG